MSVSTPPPTETPASPDRSPEKAAWRIYAWAIGRWVLAIVVLAYLVYTNVYLQWDQIAPLFERGIAWWAVVASGLSFAAVLANNFYRWYLLVRAQDFDFTYLEAVRLGCVGMLFNFVAPGSIGGDLVKGAMIAQRQSSRRLVAASTVVLDRFLGMLALLVVGFVGYLLLPPEYKTGVFAVLGTGFGIGAAVGAVGLVVALVPSITASSLMHSIRTWPYVGRALGGILDTLRIYQQRWRVVLFCEFISLFSHVGLGLSLYFASLSLASGSLVPELRTQVVVMCGSNFGAAFIPTPGGVGAFEAAVAGGFELSDRATTSDLARDVVPPRWSASVNAFRYAKDSRLKTTADDYEIDSPERLDGVLGELEKADDRTITKALSEPSDHGGTSVPAEAVVEAYRSGHATLVYSTGLLAGLLYRVLTVLVAIVGGLFYLAGRREIDTAMEQAEHPDATG